MKLEGKIYSAEDVMKAHQWAELHVCTIPSPGGDAHGAAPGSGNYKASGNAGLPEMQADKDGNVREAQAGRVAEFKRKMDEL